MTSLFPITLVGDALGQRHRHLNSLVLETHGRRVPLESLQYLPEHSPLDRLFKIDLASKYRHVEYIILNLKHEDMLYVSRALKSSWLLDAQYCHIINPVHLEEQLYPHMIAPAVNKMKHWIHLNLRDCNRCEEFFEFYRKSNIGLAIKFLRHCSEEFILTRTPDILERLEPQDLKLLSEKCSQIVKIYFDSFATNNAVLTKYLKEERRFYSCLKNVLKKNADIFLDITEKYHYYSHTLSPEATKYIMTHHKSRFNNKPELYAGRLLHMKTLAKCLSEDEIKDTVLKLAKAKYLSSWFSYKMVEPLLKELNAEERRLFKNKVFVKKNFGEMVKEWPYEPPTRPQIKRPVSHIFIDVESYHNDDFLEYSAKSRRSLIYAMHKFKQISTYLDKLFNKYRFISFEKILKELQRKMRVENLHNRQDMMLVLVSKSGGRPESVEKLLNLLVNRHNNEPSNLRAAIVRSFVKRCAAWRFSQTSWDLLMRFGRDLGLDGSTPTAPCVEGLHAVVLRNMLFNCDCDPLVMKAFWKEFCTFKEYSLTAAERRVVCNKLPTLLLSAIKDNSAAALSRVNQLLDTLEVYNIRVDQCPNALATIITVIRDASDAHSLLNRLFEARIARKELCEENFKIKQDDASYFNALNHNISILNSGKEFKKLVEQQRLQHPRFLQALSLYFGEKNGLAETYLSVLESSIDTSPDNKLAQAIALLGGNRFLSILKALDSAPKDSASKRLSAALRANAHLVRPRLDIDSLGWKYMGAKAVATYVLTCSAAEADDFIKKLLSWHRTERLALALSMRVGNVSSTFQLLASKSPLLAVKTALWYNRRERVDSNVWLILIPTIAKLGTTTINDRLVQRLSNVEIIPIDVKPDYCVEVFNVVSKMPRDKTLPLLRSIEHILPKMNVSFVETIIGNFLNKEFTNENVSNCSITFRYTSEFNNYIFTYMRIIAKSLLLSTSESTQKRKLDNVAEPFLDRFVNCWNEAKREHKETFSKYLNEFIRYLKYTDVFLDTQYVSCLPVFEYIINRLHSVLPLELHFEKYVSLHLTMLYYKAIRQSVSNNPSVFKDLPRNIEQATEIVGTIFGKYIARELNELVDKYFESIRVVYNEEVTRYFNSFFKLNQRNAIFLVHVIKGILKDENIKSHLLAEQLYNKFYWEFPDSDSKSAYTLLKQCKSDELQYFLYANHVG